MERNINYNVPDANVMQRLFASLKHYHIVIYIKAIRDLKKGEEILYNMGIQGTGLDLPWGSGVQ